MKRARTSGSPEQLSVSLLLHPIHIRAVGAPCPWHTSHATAATTSCCRHQPRKTERAVRKTVGHEENGASPVTALFHLCRKPNLIFGPPSSTHYQMAAAHCEGDL